MTDCNSMGVVGLERRPPPLPSQQSQQSELQSQSTTSTAALQKPPPISDFLLPHNTTNNPSQPPIVVDTNPNRAVHKVRLSALAHNFTEVESAANRQRCSVIVVVKADGYGHGAIPTAIFLADTVGADAFAVATLEEAIALRRAFQQTASIPPGNLELLNRLGNHHPPNPVSNNGPTTAIAVVASAKNGIIHNHHHPSNNRLDQDNLLLGASSSSLGGNDTISLLYGPPSLRRRSQRQAHVRILVLGPPVGFPRCFDDYYHHNIEVMVSGPEVAKALLEWVLNKKERMRKQVERAAAEAKERILSDEDHAILPNGVVGRPRQLESQESLVLSTNNNGDLLCIVSGTTATASSGDNQSLSSSNRSVQSSSLDSSGMPAPQQQAAMQPLTASQPQYHPPSATLSNVTGSDLAKEVREILKIQKLAGQQQHQKHQHSTSTVPSIRNPQFALNKDPNQGGTQTPASGTSSTLSSSQDLTRTTSTSTTMTTTTTLPSMVQNTVSGAAPVQIFSGIEDAARISRTRQKAIANGVFHEDEDDDDENDAGDSDNNIMPCNNSKPQTTCRLTQLYQNGSDTDASQPKPPSNNNNSKSNGKARIPTNTNRNAMPTPPKKRLRWHAMVDSGMGRLGFRTDPVSKEDQGHRRDSVEIIKELVDLEYNLDCPVEFFGMCTHMADANNTKKYDYTHAQIQKFKSLLKRVRAAGISVPTISTDNSAALLTSNLTHFDAKELLTQPGADTRGFVRTGGAIFGQRPAFPQLRAVSTLMASVRHVAILKKGESVGYDRAYEAEMNVRIATLTVGFADGYDRALGNKEGEVSIRGHRFPVVGNICMDMMMVELGPASDKDGPGAQVVVGDTAILWGPDDGEDGDGHVPLKELADKLGTTQSALTCGLNKERVTRRYA
ncbi:alanine racemase [Nitzschia inconspicua]|uniref:Alanine racemase n=1 Tax=Nitzschia inconspicua TaxID=303405 RepID=A0A9K3PNE6_9STRA|nr:alanine racemase [Nitzschia inconspicua]